MALTKRKLSEAISGANESKDAENEGSPPAKRRHQRSSLFVHSLAPQTTTDDLIEHFSQSYPVKHGAAVINPSTKLCRGYGFISFAQKEDAHRAVETFNGSVLLGRKIKVDIAEPRQRGAQDGIDDTLPPEVRAAQVKEVREQRRREQEQKAKEQRPPPPKLIVRNLPWSIKESDQLAKLFMSYGKVKSATVPKKGKLQAGFGFVLLRGKKNAEMAMAEINGKVVDGRTLAVDWAVDKETWEEHTKKDEEEQSKSKAETMGDDEKGGGESIYHEEGDGNGSELADESLKDDESQEEEVSDLDNEDEDDDSERERRPEDYSATLFIRNLPFTSMDDGLKEHFEQFGGVRYARVVLDPNTERSRGTGFVCFFKAEDAQSCLRRAPKPKPMNSKDSKTPSHSVLQSDQDDPSGKYTLEGRVLQVAPAVDRSEAARLTEEGISKRNDRDKDKRRLFLLSEGTITSNSPLFQKLSPSEIAMREASAKQRKSILQTNPSLHLSLTRLSVRNIPRTITSKDLKALARQAVVEFAKDVKEGKRERLSKEELARGGEEMVEAEKNRKKKGVGIVKQAKVVFEGREGGKVSEESGAGRSRGYGFIEYSSHRQALMGLRWLNGHAIDYKAKQAEGPKKAQIPDATERKKRMIVEFAIENAQVVNRRKEIEKKSRERSRAEGQESQTKSQPDSGAIDASKKKKLVGQGKSSTVKGKSSGGGDKAQLEAEKLAKRQRIIAKKRASKREKKRASRA